MSVILELEPEVERRIAEHAAARGLTVQDFLTTLIKRETLLEFPPRASIEEFEADMRLLSEGSEHLPVLPPEAFSRAAIYDDHD
jgi:hypothetical protein